MRASQLLEAFGELQGKYGDLDFEFYDNTICVPTGLSPAHVSRFNVDPVDAATSDLSSLLMELVEDSIVETTHSVNTWGTIYMYTLANGSKLWVYVNWFRDFSGFYIDQLQFFKA